MVTTTNNPIEFRIEKSGQVSQPFIWRVYTKGGGKKLAYSETYTQREGAINAVNAVQAGKASYSVFKGSDGKWYFHIKSTNDVDILARSAFKYDTEARAKADSDLIRLNASTAPFYDYAKAA